MRIVLFPVLLFFTPALFKVCAEVCKWQFQWLAGIRLIQMQEIGELTFTAMLLWFVLSYFLGCLITVNIEYFLERR